MVAVRLLSGLNAFTSVSMIQLQGTDRFTGISKQIIYGQHKPSNLEVTFGFHFRAFRNKVIVVSHYPELSIACNYDARRMYRCDSDATVNTFT